MINFDVTFESMLIAFSSQFSSSFKVNLGVLIICVRMYGKTLMESMIFCTIKLFNYHFLPDHLRKIFVFDVSVFPLFSLLKKSLFSTKIKDHNLCRIGSSKRKASSVF